jgi:phosphatidylserine/phosphatidylglycerophosphate/cardiolipin synthase-like enzyme
MNLLNDDLINVIEEAVESAEQSILIISPYIKYTTATRVVHTIKNKSIKLRVLTLPPGEEYITGATDLEAILTLQANGFEIKMLPSLHAKIYLFDEKRLFIGSANFTNKGLGLAKEPNKEIIMEKRPSLEELALITNEFWNHEEVRPIDYYKGFEKQVKKLQERYSLSLNKQISEINFEFEKAFQKYSPHEELLIKLRERNN